MAEVRRVLGPRGGLLRQRNFRLFWTGESISEVGNCVTIVVIALVAIDTLHTSTFIVTLLTVMVWLPGSSSAFPPERGSTGCHPGPSCWPVMRSRWRCTRASVSPPGAGGVLTVAQLIAVTLIAGAAAVFFNSAYQVLLPG